MNYEPHGRNETPKQDPKEIRGVSLEVYTVDEHGEENKMYNKDGLWFDNTTHEQFDFIIDFTWYYNIPKGLVYIANLGL